MEGRECTGWAVEAMEEAKEKEKAGKAWQVASNGKPIIADSSTQEIEEEAQWMFTRILNT